MKIVRNTPELLILEERPILLTLLLLAFTLGLAWGAIGLWGEGERVVSVVMGLMSVVIAIVLATTFRRVRLFLDAATDTFSVRTADRHGTRTVSYPLHHLDKAMVETSNSGDGGPTHRVAYILRSGMDVGRHPVTSYFTGGTGPRTAADAINAWLAAHRGA